MDVYGNGVENGKEGFKGVMGAYGKVYACAYGRENWARAVYAGGIE